MKCRECPFMDNQEPYGCDLSLDDLPEDGEFPGGCCYTLEELEKIFEEKINLMCMLDEEDYRRDED